MKRSISQMGFMTKCTQQYWHTIYILLDLGHCDAVEGTL